MTVESDMKLKQIENLVVSMCDEINHIHKAIDKLQELPIYRFSLREDVEADQEIQFIPKKANAKDTGYDVRACLGKDKKLVVKPGQTVKIPLGFRAYCPDGYWFQLVPRSSTFAKKSLHALYGTIDETFEGFLVFCAKYLPDDDKELVIEHGEAIAQIVPYKRQDIYAAHITSDDIEEMYANRNGTRGAGGFGSTDSK